LVRSRRHVEPALTIQRTLGEHYQEKCRKYQVDVRDIYDQDLLRLFSDAPRHSAHPAASTFLRRHRAALRRASSGSSRQYDYAIDQVLAEMIARCRQLNLRLRHSERKALRNAVATIATQTMNYVHAGHHRLAL
jgi:hypothetical protein